ncbi:hypothetical protein AJ80_03345 [Polytolypa hystricis UAMH7299]|uniref:Uncharacterized protein n=1 Tax=Polytolypa hystricis (strain UAMH7299) TaxID=1447883 RepID=A0A2B7YJ19_POLH7|nr:hypothetical protein AJ80_03345 [Polytolypa hystricis UAMH7299]
MRPSSQASNDNSSIYDGPTRAKQASAPASTRDISLSAGSQYRPIQRSHTMQGSIGSIRSLNGSERVVGSVNGGLAALKLVQG